MFHPNLSEYGYGFVITKASLGPAKVEVPVIEHNGGINGFNTVIVRISGKNGVIVLLDNTSQGQYLDRIVTGIMDILYDQPYEGPRRSIAETLNYTIGEKGIDAAVTQYRDLKANKANDYDFSEGELNTLGYQLLRGGKKREAIEIFKLNVEAFPKGFNTYDSLGEAYMVNGDKENAIANYKKSLELNPTNA